MSTQGQGPDLSAIKAKQQKTWASGDFSMVASTLTIVSETLCEAAGVRPDEKVIDVATGSGNTALAAARRWCEVTGVDYVPALLERGRERAAAERLPVTFLEGDAERLPAEDGAFDVALSTFGSMFAPDQERAAAELLRVVRPGGRIGMANWSPDGFIGQLFRMTAGHVPPPPGLKSPILWGTQDRVRELFGDAVSAYHFEHRTYPFRYRSAAHWIEFFRSFYGPTQKAFDALDEAGQAAYAADLEALLARFDEGRDGTLLVRSEYLEVVAVKR
jgi:ubiquinone/menaquinone biosynthesis C-methylase UbiE